MGIFSSIKTKIITKFQQWKEIGEYRSSFSSFGREAYKSELVRSCIRPLADFTSKANAKCSDQKLEYILNVSPNMYMNGKEFLSKCRTHYELQNTCFIYIERDDRGKVASLFPVPYNYLEAVEAMGKLFIKFTFKDRTQRYLPWDDLVVLRKDYNESNYVGDDNKAILDTLQLIQTSNESVANAIKATANLRGILKSTKAMLSDDDIKKQKDRFVNDYLTLENEGGIASLDATQEFVPINMTPVMSSYSHMKEFRENVYRYFGVNDNIVMANMTSEQLEVFYEMRIEPFLVDLSTELTKKIYNKREMAYGNWIVYEANKLQFCSLDKKIQMFATVVLYGGMTVNEWREGCNMSRIEGGDELIRRLDAAPVEDQPKQNKEKENDNEGN